MSGQILYLETIMPEIRVTPSYEASCLAVLSVMLFPRDSVKAHAVVNTKNRDDLLAHVATAKAGEDPLWSTLQIFSDSLRAAALETARSGVVAGDVLNIAYLDFVSTGKCSMDPAIEKYMAWVRPHKYGDGKGIRRSKTQIRDSIDAVSPAIHLWAAYRHLDGSESRHEQFSREGLRVLIGIARSFENFVLNDKWRKLRSGKTLTAYDDLYRFINCPIPEILPDYKVV